MGKERFYKTIIIPEQLLEDVEKLGLTKGKSGFHIKALHFISILMDKSNRKMGNKFKYYSVSQSYFLNVFGDRYYKFLNPMRDSELVLCDYRASADAGRPHGYALNPKYFKGQANERKVTVSYKMDVEKDLTEEDRVAMRDFKRFYNLLTINREKLYEKLYKKLESIDKEVYKMNEKVDAKHSEKIKYSNGVKTRYAYVWQLIDKASKSDENLIQDGGDYFFMIEDDYKMMKQSHINSTWTVSIENLAEGNLRVLRDKKGKREHTNLTNFPTELREIVFKDSKVANPDINNSQFAFYTMIGRKKGLNSLDADTFFTACEEGRIYELVRDELGLSKGDKGRKEAKFIMFLICFSSDEYKSVYKTMFRKRFPSIAQDISDFKQQFGSKAFPLMLQQVEADYILDKVRPRLKKMGVVTASIHDSICIKEEHAETTIRVMREVAEEIGLKAQIDEDEPQQEIQIFKEVA